MERKGQTVPTAYSEVPQNHEFSLEKAKKVFLFSFKFSQGAPDIQRRIFWYLHFLRPGWKISDDFATRLAREVVTPINTIVQGKNNGREMSRLHKSGLSDIEILDQISDQLLGMQVIFNNKNKKKPNTYRMAQYIVIKDRKFICEEGGRVRNVNFVSHGYNAALDPFLSHICYYGLEGNSTGLEEYDEMFKDVTRETLEAFKRKSRIDWIFNTKAIDKKFRGDLIAVVDKYAETHPQSVPKLKSLGFQLGNIA